MGDRQTDGVERRKDIEKAPGPGKLEQAVKDLDGQTLRGLEGGNGTTQAW